MALSELLARAIDEKTKIKDEELIEGYEPIINLLEKFIRPKNDAEHYYRQGQSLYGNGKYKEALMSFEEVSNIITRSSYYHYKGKTLLKLKYMEEAIKAFDKAIELKSDYANAYYNKGNSLWHLGKYEEVIEEYNKAIGLNPDDAIAYSNKGTALFELKRYEEAIKEYDKTIELKPDNAIAYYSKGNAYNFLKQYDEAIKCCNKAIELDPKYAPTFCHKGYALYGLKKYQEAIIEYNTAIALDPKYENAIVDKRMVLDAIACQARDKDFEVLLENTPLSPGARKVAEQKIASLKSLQNGSNEKSYVEKYLNYLFRLPWGKYDAASIDIIEAEKILNNNHYGLSSVKQKIIEFLVFMANSKNAKPPILCLVGAPGVGKTSIAKIISKALNRKSVTLSLAGAIDECLIRGCMDFYVGAKPGKALSLLSEVGSSNPVMILDEIDKITAKKEAQYLKEHYCS